MRLCVSHVYWMLLITSIVSSALLFLIVASESIHNSKFIGPDRNQAIAQEENATFSEDSKDQLVSDSQSKPSIKILSSLKPKLRDPSFQDIQAPISTSFDTVNKNEEPKIPEEIEILKESLTQQPNLSQGISDGGQAVVLTLVDAAANLQSLASGRTDFRPKAAAGSEGNVSAGGEQRISQMLEANANASDETGGYYEAANQPDVVVVVRAEQKSRASIHNEVERSKESESAELEQEEVPEEEELRSQQLPKSPTTAPDLNDSAARARLTGSADDSAAVILDGLVTAGSSEPHEDIPSFNEWAQKRLEEAEKKKTHPNVSVQTASRSPGRNVGNMRMRSKNYASPDCGAKIVAVNPEARSARNILVATRDEYMLNTCTSRIWFVVELCEAIQARKIELANFELFSSSPKDISVYVSDRFPTRDWTMVGQFTAKDERDVQSFSLQPHLFGKFIKLELHSHYGSEHFCPISLFRAYGTSEFEVLETETETDTHSDNRRRGNNAEGRVAAGSNVENDDDDDEESVFQDEEESTSDPPGHLFGSARDAVLSIVKKAAEVLVKSEDKPINNSTDNQASRSSDVLKNETINDCTTPAYSVVCQNCSDDRFARIFQLVSCKSSYLESLLNTDFVYQTLAESHLCVVNLGFNSFFETETYLDDSKAVSNMEKGVSSLQEQYVLSLFTPDYIMALCNVLAAREQRLFVNVSQQQHQIDDKAPNETRLEDNQVPLSLKEDRVLSTQIPDTVLTSDVHTPKIEASVIKSKLEVATESQTFSESPSIMVKPLETIVPGEDMKKHSFSANPESSNGYQLEDNEIHHVETPTTDMPVQAVNKRITSTKVTTAGSQDQSQVMTDSQEEIPAVPVPKLPQNADPTNTGTDNVEAEIKKEEDSEQQSEHEIKVPPQDPLILDSFDFKELDVDNLHSNGAVKNDASFNQQTANAGTPQQKESVFLRLSNRIKALERNMSLSSQYLEELSRRYKKQVEEMQRSLERAMQLMNEESRKGEERESKRLEEITALREEIGSLTKVLDDLVYERNSWSINFSSLIQHCLFVFVDVVLVILVISYCRRSDDDLDYYDEDVDNKRIIVAKPRRGKSYEIVKQTCNQLTKKPKKRRPSEIASQVRGTYDQLMIEDSQSSKKDKRKKRKKECIVLRYSSAKESDYSKGDGNSQDIRKTMHSRSASANDALYAISSSSAESSLTRPESAPDNSISYFSDPQKLQYDTKIQILDVSNEKLTKTEDEASPEKTNVPLEDDVFEQAESSSSTSRGKSKKLSSPSFMKTALGSRSKRISFSGSSVKKQSTSLDESMARSIEKRYEDKMGSLSEMEASNYASDEHKHLRAANGHVEESDESRSSSATPTSSWNKKEKKSNGLKKMVRKFF